MCHGVKLGKDNVMVFMDEMLDLYEVLPILSLGMVYVRDADKAFVAWPQSLVILPFDDVYIHLCIWCLQILSYHVVCIVYRTIGKKKNL